MNSQTYKLFENFMLKLMEDSAHDSEHIYRVLYVALDIAGYEPGVDYDVLICACLLHDIGRGAQFENPEICHASKGAEIAYEFLLENGFSKDYAERVSTCIKTHRYRAESPPVSIEAKILFDADKVDVTGSVGIARTLLYAGQVSTPLYTLTEDGRVSDGTGEGELSFFGEYKFKLEGIYECFYTKRGAEIANARRAAAASYYESLLSEVSEPHETGATLLGRHISE